MTDGVQHAGAGDAARGSEVKVYTFADERPEQIPNEAWQISARLLTTLDAERMVELFTRELVESYGYDSFVYQHDDMGIVFSDGAPACHELAYQLMLGGRSLGELRISRRQRFHEDEIQRIENLICGLVYALRNAMLYREAVTTAYDDPHMDAVDDFRSAA